MQTSNIHSRLRLRRVLMFLVVAGGIAALVAVLLAVVSIALPLTRRLIFVGLSEALLNGRLESLAVDLDIQPGLKWLFSLLIILPVGFGLSRMMLAREFSKALRGLALALGTLLALGIFAWVRTQHFNFDAQGHPVVYLSFHREGVRKSYHAGLDRVTGRPKQPVTLERVVWLTELVRQPVRVVDPAIEGNWFDANSGEPNLWYVENTPGLWQFFNRPHFHQQLQVEAQPITREFMARWQVQHQRQVEQQNAEQRRREEAAKAEAQVKAQAAKQEAEQAAAAKASETARLKAQEEEAQRLRTEQIQNRGAREGIPPPTTLDYLQVGHVINQEGRELTGESFQATLHDREYFQRRCLVALEPPKLH